MSVLFETIRFYHFNSVQGLLILFFIKYSSKLNMSGIKVAAGKRHALKMLLL